MGIGVSLLLWPSRPDQPTAYDAQLRTIWHRKMAADAQALRAADSALAVRSVTLTRNVVRFRELRDTLNLTDTVQVKVFVARSDSVVRSCTELLSSCALYRVRAESVIAGLQTENDALAAEVKALHPSRVGRLWDRVKMPGAFILGAYIGSRVVR